jgi:hypothetical protein
VNERHFDGTAIESVFLSSAIEATLLNNFCSQQFSISSSSIDSNGFSNLHHFVQCDRNGDSPSISISTAASPAKAFSN